MNKLKLSDVTLISVAGNKQSETVSSLYKSMSQVEFASVKLITNINIICAGIEIINVGGLKTWHDYNNFILKELYKYIDTDFCLIVQWDSWILNADCWDDEFFKYDIVGAKWMYSDGRNVANGGFKLQTKQLCEITAKDDIIEITSPEDEVLGRLYRKYLEDRYNIKYCTEEVADKFSFELHEPIQKTFGFHAFHHQPYRECVVLKRTGALGDVLMLEPVIDHFATKGLKVYLDTSPHYLQLFINYRHVIYHISKLNTKVKPELYIDFDMAYEIKPKQPVLKSYYELAGITHERLTNSQLDFNIHDSQKLFKKYVVIHIDDTDMPHRNIRGVEWDKVKKYLNKRGYDVIQVGKGKHEDVGLYLNTEAIGTLMYALKGASLFIGGDSGCAQISVALSVPSVIFFQSVNPELRYNDFTNIRVVQNKCERQHCYHEVISTTGQPCFYNPKLPPCSIYTAEQVIDKIKELL